MTDGVFWGKDWEFGNNLFPILPCVVLETIPTIAEIESRLTEMEGR